MIRHNFTNLLEYVPSYYPGGNSTQAQSRLEVYDFKDGRASATVKNGLLTKIRSIIKDNASDWVVCFIPASSKDKTYNRYSSLALFLARELQCDVFIDAVVNSVDTQSGCKCSKSNNPTANFIINGDYVRGKNVILIDDVITRGTTFDHTADKLERNGAKTVTGLFVARTTHPKRHESSSHRSVVSSEFVQLYTDYLCDGLSEAQAAEFASEFIAARQRDSEDYYCIS